MNDEDLLRYSRHILLDDIGVEGQERILNEHVIIIGARGLGSAAAPYLAAAGVGQISLVDHDAVDLTNLQRQIMHRHTSVGMAKVVSGKQMLEALNPNCQVHTYQQKADSDLLNTLLPTVDVVLDCTDNYATRQLINRSCVAFKKPLVSGAAIRFDGQITVIDPRIDQSACYACMFSPEENFVETKCSTMGVFSPLVGTIGTLQAAQALQILGGFGEPLSHAKGSRLLMWDALRNEMNQIHLKKRLDCPVCSKAS